MVFVGRESEVRRISERLGVAGAGHGANVILLAGSAGIGKSALVEETTSLARDTGFQVIKGSCMPNSELYLPFIQADEGLRKVLRPELRVRFDEVFLVDSIGRLMVHKTNVSTDMDEDILGGMLTAVQDFIEHSFGDRGRKSGLKKMEYGRTSILLENGEHSFIACVLREGRETEEMRRDIRDALLKVEGELGGMPRWDGDLATVQPLGAHLQHLIDKGYRPSQEMSFKDLEAETIVMFDSALGYIRDLSSHDRLLLVVEDLHWGDEYSLRLLEFLARNAPERATLLCTFRPEDVLLGEAHPIDGELQISVESGMRMRGGYISKISSMERTMGMELSPLSRDETVSLLRHELEGEMSEGLVSALYERTAGNPLYVKELARHLRETEGIASRGGMWEMVSMSSLPESIKGTISRRLERLSAGELSALEFSAALGRSFESSVLGHAYGDEGVHLAERFVEQDYLSRLPGERPGYEFYHALIHDVVYSGISDRWLHTYHKLAGETYEELYPEDERPVFTLAHHFSRTREHEKSVRYSTEAGDVSFTSFAPDDSTRYYETALESTERLPRTSETAAGRLGLLMKLAASTMAAARWDESESYGTMALELSRELGLEGETARSLHILGDLYQQMGEYEKAERSLKEAREGYRGMNDHTGYSITSVLMGNVLWRVSRHSEALELLEEARGVAEHLDDKRALGKVILETGNVLGDMGRLDEALEYMDEALRILEPAGELLETARIYNNIADTLTYLGRGELGAYERALVYIDKAVEIADRIKSVYYRNWFNGTKCEVLMLLGRIDEALPLIDENMEFAVRMNDVQSIGLAHMLYGRAYRQRGEYKRGEDHLEKALELIRQVNRPYFVSYTLLEYGLLLKASGKSAEGRARMDEAMEIAGGIGAQHLIDLIEKEL